jgi:hypothetical protein
MPKPRGEKQENGLTITESNRGARAEPGRVGNNKIGHKVPG